MLTKEQIAAEDLDRALGELSKLTPLAKSRLLQACATSIWYDLTSDRKDLASIIGRVRLLMAR